MALGNAVVESGDSSLCISLLAFTETLKVQGLLWTNIQIVQT